MTFQGILVFPQNLCSKCFPRPLEMCFGAPRRKSKCSQAVVRSTLLHFLSVWWPSGLKSEVPTIDVAKCDISGNFNFSSKSVFKMLPKASRNVFWCAADVCEPLRFLLLLAAQECLSCLFIILHCPLLLDCSRSGPPENINSSMLTLAKHGRHLRSLLPNSGILTANFDFSTRHKVMLCRLFPIGFKRKESASHPTLLLLVKRRCRKFK